MLINDAKPQMVTETVTAVNVQDGVTYGELESGRVQLVRKGTKVGDKASYLANNQVGDGRGDNVVGPWSLDPRNSQDNALPLGLSVSGNTFAFNASSRTDKVLTRLALEPLLDSPGYLTTLEVAGQNTICSERRDTGFKVPLAMFDPSLIGQAKFNNANLITPGQVPFLIEGAFLNGVQDRIAGGWATDLVPDSRLAAYKANKPSRSTAAIGDINWIFELESQQIPAGETRILTGKLARGPVTLGQLVLQASEPGAVNQLIPRARGLSIVNLEIAGYPTFSASNVDGLGAGPYSYDTADMRQSYIGKRLTNEGQVVSLTVKNNLAVTVDALSAIWCGRE